MKKFTLSVVVPIFNEEVRVHKAIESLRRYLPEQWYDHEIIFVDDGSSDRTVEVIRRAGLEHSRIVSYQPNMGKGYALKKGVLASRGDYVLLLDVDMSTPIESFADFLPLMEEKVPVIIGTRRAVGAQVIVSQKKTRQKMGACYTFLANIILVHGISDFTCGFKCFSRSAGRIIFAGLRTNRWSWDAEAIFIARKMHFEIREVPVQWTNDPRTKVHVVRDALESLLDLLRIRFRHYH